MARETVAMETLAARAIVWMSIRSEVLFPAFLGFAFIASINGSGIAVSTSLIHLYHRRLGHRTFLQVLSQRCGYFSLGLAYATSHPGRTRISDDRSARSGRSGF